MQGFLENSVDFPLTHTGIDFLFLTSHWGNKPYFWNPKEEQIPYLLSSQLEELKTPGKTSTPMVLVTHSPIFGLPCEQTGMSKPLHPPEGEFSEIIRKKTEGLPVKLVLGAHNHMNMNVEMDGINYVTVSAFTEMPFEFKLFEITETALSMKTVSLSAEVNFRSDYCFDKTFVQGRLCDRSFGKKLK